MNRTLLHTSIDSRTTTKLALEGLVVVVSILIAFALDAWWDDRQLEQETAEDLAIVEYELAENIRLIQITMDILYQVVAANRELVAQLTAHPDADMVDVADNVVFWSLFSHPTFDPSFGATDAWIATGRLQGLESAVLRQRLASVRGKVEDVVEEQRIAREISVEQIYPLVKDQIDDIGLIEDIFSAGFGARQSTGVQPPSQSGLISFPNSNALRFLLQAKTLWYVSSIDETRDFQSELEQIQVMLQDEMRQFGSRDRVSPIEK